ncbi:MAG: preprotein translocase subunit SecE [Candidatus Pacebacteria bacterium]|nr:preprotein translocase subunit SecE [Candidatus Paceibacterota bacterium]
MKKYLSEVKTELSKTTWPSKQTTKNLTILVVIVSLLLALYIGALDIILQKLIALFI